MTDKIERDSRVTVSFEGVVTYDGGADIVQVRAADEPYGAPRAFPRAALSNLRPPIQRPGAKVWRQGDEGVCRVVLHDAPSGQYVLRTAAGQLILRPDDAQISTDPVGGDTPPGETFVGGARVSAYTCETCHDNRIDPPTDKIAVKNGEKHCADCGGSLEIPF